MERPHLHTGTILLDSNLAMNQNPKIFESLPL